MEFLWVAEANINLSRMEITLHNKKYELYRIKNEVNEKLENKSKIYCKSRPTLTDKINNLLNTNESQNSNIGKIPKVKHIIKLKTDEIVKVKPFRIPLSNE